MDANSARSLAEEVLEAINSRDYREIDRLTTEDVNLRLPPDQVFYGREGVREFLLTIEKLTPRFTLTAGRIHAGTDFAVVEYDGVMRSQREHEFEQMGALVLEMTEGRVRRIAVYLDTAIFAQLNQGVL